MTLVLNQTARVDFQLKVGQASETSDVTSAAPLLHTDTTQLSTIIDSHTNADLPLLSRNYLQLALLAPCSACTEWEDLHSFCLEDRHQRKSRDLSEHSIRSSKFFVR
jgi:hypothetical protein